jgi:hypothetical protein
MRNREAAFLFTEIYKTLPGLTNLYRTLRAPVLKSNHCPQAIEMIVAVVSTIRSQQIKEYL